MNKVILMGRLTKDPEVRFSANKNGENMAIARFTLAVDRKFGNRDEADFITCVAFGKQGEFVEKYLKKGTKIACSGRIQTGSYKNKDGQTIYTTEVVIEEMEFAESKSNNESSTPSAKSNDDFMDIPENITESLPFK